MMYIGQKIQIDVIFVPSCCLVNQAHRKKFINILLLMNFLVGDMLKLLKNTVFEEHSTYTSAKFLEHLIQRFSMPIKYVQTNN